MAYRTLLTVHQNPNDLIDQLKNYTPPKVDKAALALGLTADTMDTP